MAEEILNAEAPQKKAKKAVMMVAGILVVEAVLIVGAMKFFLAGHAAPVSAVDVAHSADAGVDEKIVEVPVLNARMPNNKSGVAYIYNAEVFAQVKTRDADRVKSEIEQFQNEIKADITAIWRTAEPQYFQEPRLETLTRKVHALLNERFGVDKERGEPIVSKVVIVMSTGFRIDS